jgi:transketolase
MLESLRAMPNLLTFRPADGNEVVGSYVNAIEHPSTPSVISLSRQAAPTIEGTSATSVNLGGYVVQRYNNADAPDLILVATGTELQLAVAVAKALAAESLSIRVVSMPCTELFDKQSITYQLSVFPEGVPVMSIELSATQGWRKYAHAPFGINTFGQSAPAAQLFEYFGFTEANLAAKAKEVIQFYRDQGGAPSMLLYPKFEQAGNHH